MPVCVTGVPSMGAWAFQSDTGAARARLICMPSCKAWWFGWKLKSCISIRSASQCDIVEFYGLTQNRKYEKIHTHSVNSVAFAMEPLHCLHSVFLLFMTRLLVVYLTSGDAIRSSSGGLSQRPLWWCLSNLMCDAAGCAPDSQPVHQCIHTSCHQCNSAECTGSRDTNWSAS